MNKKDSKLDKINYGFSLLKMLLAFEVLLGHFANWEEYDPRIVWPFRELVSLAVPCFVILSFYLTEKSYLRRDAAKFKDRFVKLLIPQLVWAVIYYAIYAIIDLFMHKGLHSGPFDLFWQSLTGHSRYLNPSMWYQFDMILITLIFYYIFKYLDDKKGYLALFAMTVFCYIIQFAGVNRALFGDLEFELKYPLGRIAEMIPFAFIGFSLKYFNIYEKAKKYRYLVLIACPILFLQGYRIPWTELNDFGFSGFAKPYLAFWIVTFAFMVPFEYLNLGLKKFILKLTDFSLGIYCVHRLVNTLLLIFIPSISLHSFERCIMLYIVCYAVCYLIHKIPGKNFEIIGQLKL